ncbi:MAG: hypothetical protein P4L22_07100 [Candidatus Babeliales bacterium]|nr:hypothetical protein [Candidatus Babeliales bacterium]
MKKILGTFILSLVFAGSIFGAEKSKYILACKQMLNKVMQTKTPTRQFHSAASLHNRDFNSLLNTFHLSRQIPIEKRLPITPNQTQTTQHLKYFINNKLNFDLQKLNVFSDPVKGFLEKIHDTEVIEHEKGNYVLYHARSWKWNFISDIYKELWKILNNTECKENFQFLRFKFPQKYSLLYGDILYTNCALFSNLTSLTSCSMHFWHNNFDYSKDTVIPLYKIFEKLNLHELYAKYFDQLVMLEELHRTITSHGEILLISIPEDKIDNVITIDTAVTIKGRWKLKPKEILDTLKNNPHDFTMLDQTELGLILGKYDRQGNYIANSYSNNPINGPDIFSFSMHNLEKLKEYKNLRDEIFAKIRADIASE